MDFELWTLNFELLEMIFLSHNFMILKIKNFWQVLIKDILLFSHTYLTCMMVLIFVLEPWKLELQKGVDARQQITGVGSWFTK